MRSERRMPFLGVFSEVNITPEMFWKYCHMRVGTMQSAAHNAIDKAMHEELETK